MLGHINDTVAKKIQISLDSIYVACSAWYYFCLSVRPNTSQSKQKIDEGIKDISILIWYSLLGRSTN